MRALLSVDQPTPFVVILLLNRLGRLVREIPDSWNLANQSSQPVQQENNNKRSRLVDRKKSSHSIPSKRTKQVCVTTTNEKIRWSLLNWSLSRRFCVLTMW